jgi:hypothetical protein
MEDAPEFPAVTAALETAPPPLTAIPGREDPVIWVERLAIYKSWPPCEQARLRQIDLRRGLNVIWAHPIGENAAASRLAGHSAGKSTFCRLLRYVLDDTTAGTADFRKRFEQTFGIGWAVAEVHVAAGYHSFAYPGGSLTQEFPERPPRVGYREYCAAIDEAVFGKMTIRVLPSSQKQLDWPQLVQWLTRDQEAHFRGLLEWRETDSDSESIPISADDRASLVRLVLGLIQQKEQPILKEFSEKTAEHESKVRERVKLEFAIERDRAALASAINLPVGDPNDPVLQLEISNQVTNLRNQSDVAVKAALQDDDNRTLLNEVARTQAEYEIARAIADDAKARVETEDNRLKGITPPPKPKEVVSPIRQMLKGMEPFHGYCSHPMDAAYKAQCPIARQRPPDDAVRQATEGLKDSAPIVRSELERLQAELKHHEDIAAEKKRVMDSAQALFDAARVRQRIELEGLKEPARTAATIEALHRSFAKGCQDLELLNGRIKGLGVDKEALNDSLKVLTKSHKELLAKFTRLFHHISQHLLDKAVNGRVEFSGKSIEPRLEYNGDRDSAALKVTKWVTFDLAALAMGITASEAYHPRFLLHDSPRESDMAPIMYAGLFYAAKEIEGACGESAPFQYIITTTEPPPEDMRQQPWLRLELDASVESERFLGVNL